MISGENSPPILYGLVLAGGRSLRMGTAKDQIKWHGIEQRYYAADMLKTCCDEVFISCRNGQETGLAAGYQALPDTFVNMGPMGGILSALRSQPDKAWLVIACDLPLLNEATLRFLVAGRDPHKIATAYKSPHDGLPEPLITIWEPDSYPVLLNFLGKGIMCPRKVLINSDKALLTSPSAEALLNVNTPEDASRARVFMEQERPDIKNSNAHG